MVDLKTWQSQLPDETKLNKLSIPGTHNSAACHIALPSVQCQGKSVTEQLEHGVRFLDYRIGHNLIGDELMVCHGNFPVKIPIPLKFSDSIQEVYAFLEANPRETVIVSIKQEGSGNWDNDNDQFANTVWDKYIAPNKDRWFLGSQMPSLGEARGKAIVFRRFGVNNEQRRNEFGVDGNGWKYNCTDDDCGAYAVQDFCEVEKPEDLPQKVDHVKALLGKAATYNETNDDKLFLNFTTASNFFDPKVWPQPVSQAMLENNISADFKKGCGIVVLDYAEAEDWKLPRELVQSNFQ